MKKLKESKTSAAFTMADATNHATPTAATKEAYVKPRIEVIELELEQPILQDSAGGAGGSDFGNGGRY